MLQTVKNIYHFFQAVLAVIWYRYPAGKLIVIGVTGTDGKTTTVNLIYHILKSAGKKVSMVSSINAVIGGKEYDTGFHVTNPSSFPLQKFFRKAVDHKDKYFVLEVTSHGLDQNRVVGCNFQIGVLTNVTHEHLDYHKTFENYFKTKLKLLKWAKKIVINRDDSSYNLISEKLKQKSATYSVANSDANYTTQIFPFKTSLKGNFNKYNILAAIACTKFLKISDDEIKKAVSNFKTPFGRMDEVYDNEFKIIVDFAHTPNAIHQALSAIKESAKGKIIHVFGSAGLRDASKRPLMGEVSGKYSDYVIITAEDPRTEDVRQISLAISQGCLKSGAKEADRKKSLSELRRDNYYWKIPDRQEAINFAIRKLAKKGDTVFISGKGHEKSMCYGKTEHPWSDYDAVKKALKIS